MRHVVPVVLLLVALIHVLPLAGVASAARLHSLYGIDASAPDLQILLRHRAVLFGLLAAFLGYAAFDRDLHAIALIGAIVSVGSFLLLAWQVGGCNGSLAAVVRVDAGALVLLGVAAAVHAGGWDRT